MIPIADQLVTARRLLTDYTDFHRCRPGLQKSVFIREICERNIAHGTLLRDYSDFH